mmetsp:Transcript_36552/g.60128  ORF Transcript_36552/g.60128 Transcript_36552/m.60128 type:complete len:208 (-) Transcript_36552:141-764(-)
MYTWLSCCPPFLFLVQQLPSSFPISSSFFSSNLIGKQSHPPERTVCISKSLRSLPVSMTLAPPPTSSGPLLLAALLDKCGKHACELNEKPGSGRGRGWPARPGAPGGAARPRRPAGAGGGPWRGPGARGRRAAGRPAPARRLGRDLAQGTHLPLGPDPPAGPQSLSRRQPSPHRWRRSPLLPRGPPSVAEQGRLLWRTADLLAPPLL